MSTVGKYQCDICLKVFSHQQSLWKHRNQKKQSCVPQDELIKLNEKSKEDLSKLDYYKKQLKEQELENRVKELELEKQVRELELENQRKDDEIIRLRQALYEVDDSKHNVIFQTTTEPVDFLEHLHKNKLFNSFEEIFKDKEVDHTLIKKFISAVQKKRNVSGAKKREISYKQKDCCINCKVRTMVLEIDHIVPLYQGGDNSKENLQGLCPTCHRKKTMYEFTQFRDNIQNLCHYLYYKAPETAPNVVVKII